MNWNEQTAVITGGADGLGFSLATRLSTLGAHVALFDRDESKLAEAQETFGDIAFHGDRLARIMGY